MTNLRHISLDTPVAVGGSVPHNEVEVVVFNIMVEIYGAKPEEIFDVHSTCFIVCSKGTSLLNDFNDKIDPLYRNVLLDGKHFAMPLTLVIVGKEVG